MSDMKISELIKEHQVKFLDLRFTDTRGKEQHMTVPASIMSPFFLTHGKMFDGSSIAGWKWIHDSDMVLLPDSETAVLDPFFEACTLNIRCDVLEATTMKPYMRDPRSLAKRAEAYLRDSGIADVAYFGPEPEFFILDDVRWRIDIRGASYRIDSKEAAWNSGKTMAGGNTGYRPGIKGGYFPVPPVDSSQDIRSAMCLLLEKMGLVVEAHHHEVATGNQNEICTRFNSLLRKADELQILKYVVQNVAHAYGKTATFMAKPMVGDNGSGMHCHFSLAKNDINLFSGKEYAGLSQLALHFIGGVMHHAKALNAFTNSTTNSYKRLVPGFEAPTMLAYSARNRSAGIRIPYAFDPQGTRIEIRFPDASSNPYLAFSAILMAGLDGIEHKIHPGAPLDHDLYELPEQEAQAIPRVCHSLELAVACLDKDRDFLLKGGVFSHDLIDSYIKLKREEITRLNATTHPVEFELYYTQ